ncbi:MAG: ABC transporter substrate-binding protein, partial [Actinobacteria bacterium]
MDNLNPMPSRRRRRAGTLIAVVVALVAASVASGAPGARATVAHARVDPEGVVRWGYDLTGPGVPVYDPAKMTIYATGVVLGQLLYDSLLRQEPSGKLTPALATAAKVVDPQTISVTLRQGVKFQDGTSLNADAVKFTILRNRDAQSVAFPAVIKDVASVDVTSDLELTIHLSKPSAGAFYPQLAGLATMPVSPAAVQRNDPDPIANPMGAGPFRVKEYQPEQHLLMTKSDTYWDAKRIKLGGVEYVQAPTGPAAITALRGGNVDIIGTDLNQLDALRGGNVRAALASSPTSLLWFNLCKTRKPLDNVRVRQALNYALDRNSINRALAQGRGEPAWSLVPKSNDVFASELDGHYRFNVKKARSLLRAAGFPNGVKLTIIPSPGISQNLTEIAQQSWKRAGIDVEIVPSTNIVQDFFTDHKTDMGA